MGTRDDLISELGFLDEAKEVMDEKPAKGKPSVKEAEQVWHEEVPKSNLKKALLKAIEGLSTDAALAVLEAFRRMPDAVKDGVGAVYNALGTLGWKTSPEDVKDALVVLKEACGEKYKGIYNRTVKEVKRLYPKIQSRMFSESLG